MTRPRRSRASTHAGFTMLEMLVSIALTVIITTFITGGFHFGMRAWETSDRTANAQDAAIVERGLATWIEGAMAVSTNTNGGDSALEFDGNVDALTFVTLSDGHTQRAGLVKITVHKNPQGDLVVDLSIFRRGSVFPVSQSVLAKDASLVMAYFGAFDGVSPPTWHPEWKRKSTLPLVLAFQIRRGDRRPETPVLARLRTEAVLAPVFHG